MSNLVMDKPAPHSAGSRLALRIAREPDASRRRSLIRSGSDRNNLEFIEYLYREVVRLYHVDVTQAERLAEAARLIAGSSKDKLAKALAYRAEGHVLLARGRYKSAVERYGKALVIYRQGGQELEVGRTLYSGPLQALIYLSRYEEAFTWAAEARAIFEARGDRLRLARLDSNVGNILFRQDRFSEALQLYRQAYRELRRQNQHKDVAVALHNIATCSISLNDFNQALRTYQQARTYCEQSAMPLLAAEAEYNIAYLHYLRGEYSTALQLYAQTRARCVEVGDPYHAALSDLDRSEIYLELNLTEKALDLADSAYDGFSALNMSYEQGKALTNLAISSSRLGLMDSASQLFRKARVLFEQEKNRPWSALVDLHEALMLYEFEQDARAERLCRSALLFYSESLLSGKAALCETLLARLKLRSGKPQAAVENCVAAIGRLEPGAVPIQSCRGFFVLGQAQEALGDTRGALQSYRKAHRILEDLRSQVHADGAKIAFLKDKLGIYEGLVWIALGGRDSDLRTAFNYIEQAKSRSLVDLVASDAPGSSGDAGDSRLENLRRDLLWLQHRIELEEAKDAGQGHDRLKKLHDESRRLERQWRRIARSVGKENQAFSILHNAGTVDLESIQSSIPEDAVLIEYYVARGAVFACLLERDSLWIRPISHSARVRQVLRLLQFQLSKFSLGADYVRQFSKTMRLCADQHLRSLYDLLIAPLAPRLRNRHLIVVPHDFLHYVPFHALFDGRQYLIDRASVSYAPSASLYHFCVRKETNHTGRGLVLGVADAATPEIRGEVRSVQRVLPNADVFFGRNATVSKLRELGRRSQWIHIATHGYFRQDNPSFSAIQLGDSELRVHDLYTMDLSPDLVTLSGCSTGRNAVVGADELLGLVRGFLVAGASSLLLTLWDVNDRSTARFMQEFYGGYVSGRRNKADALKAAILATRAEFPHPYHWAPFVLVGNHR